MSQELQISYLTEKQEKTLFILKDFIREIQGKADNPQMVVNKIWEWVKPQQFKCIEIICNLIRNSSAKIEQSKEEDTVNDLVNELIDNWQEREDIQHLQDIKAAIINYDSSLSLLILYQKVITGEVIKFDKNRQVQKYLLEIGLVKKEENNLAVTNLLYKGVFNNKFVQETISNIIKNQIADIWQYGFNLEQHKNEVFKIIEKHLLIQKDLPQLALKTNNLNAIIEGILIWSNPEPCLTKELLKLASDNQSKTSIPEKEEKKWIEELVQINWIDNNNWKSQPIAEHLNQIKSKLTDNGNYNSFWLLLAYRYILRGEAIPFNSEKEQEELLLNIKLIFKNADNRLKVANNIYENIFNEQWVSNELENSQHPHSHNLLAWIDSNTFKNDVVILKNKFPNNIKNIIEEIISWVHNSSELAKLANKIVRFTETGIILNESDKQDWNIQQKSFEQNIMYSPSLGDYLDEEDFRILINNFLNTEEYQGKKGISKTNQKLQKLIGKFKNPLPIVKEIIFETQAELEATSHIVEEILKDDSIIQSEEDVDKIAKIAKEFKSKTLNNKKEQNMGLNDLLNELVGDGEQIEAIFLCQIKTSMQLQLDSTVAFINSNLKNRNKKLHEQIMGEYGLSEAVRPLAALEAASDAVKIFGEKTGFGKLKYPMYPLDNGLMLAHLLNVKGGDVYAVCFLINKSMSLTNLYFESPKMIERIENTLNDFLDSSKTN